jgi:hypothetical protein
MSTQLPLVWRTFALPKRGHKADEYEDAYAAAPAAGRFAVADGASESSFAGLWARLLVEGFTRRIKQAMDGTHWLECAQQHWADEVDGLELPWYAEEKREQGAFATFLGLSIKRGEKGGGRWKALAIGDSCLFQVRKDRLVAAFPLNRSADFGNQPALLGSRPGPGQARSNQQKIEWGTWQPGDRLFLMTDALAQWFLRRHETNGQPWQLLARRLGDEKAHAALTAYVDELRDRDGLRNDDVTLLTIDLPTGDRK